MQTSRHPILLLSVLALLSVGSLYAQNEVRTLKIFSNDKEVFSLPVDDIDYMTVVLDNTDAPDPSVPNYNGHDYVDLGLPSGLKWATCDVGSRSGDSMGSSFTWGSTVSHSNNCPTSGKSLSSLKSSGIVDSNGNLTSRYDAASTEWGGSWRTPTKEEWQELISQCTWTFLGPAFGYEPSVYRIEGPNGNTIMLPTTKLYYDFDNYNYEYDDICFYYWSATGCSDSANAYGFTSHTTPGVVTDSRAHGRSIRAVSK